MQRRAWGGTSEGSGSGRAAFPTSPDLLRQMLAAFINTLTSGEVAAVCGAPYGMPGPEGA